MKHAIRSRLRLITVLMILFLLAGFGIPGASVIFGNTPSSDRELIFATGALVFVLCGLGCVIWLTLLIRVNALSRTVSFIYPFRLRVHRVPIDQIAGYRYRYIPSRFLDYKALQLKTKDGHKFTISDFETANLRELEVWCVQNLALHVGREFKEVPFAMQDAELMKSKEFDRRQLKTLRFYLGGLTVTCVVLISLLGWGLFKNQGNENTTEALILVFLASVGAYIVWKFLRIQKVLHNGG